MGQSSPVDQALPGPGRMDPMLIDLHAHSTASDGTDSPAELMAAASAAGLDVVAITDHDTTLGWEPALAARPGPLTVIRGAEFSTLARTGSWPVSVHLLGYLFDPAHRAVVAEQARLREERLHRGMAIVRKMVAAGIPISEEQVMAIADGAPVGRPHIGRALVAAGVVTSVDEAFASYLAGRGPYYVPKADTDLPTAIGMITAAGGVSVIAHPRGRGEYRALSFEYIKELTDLGLGGLEVNHPDHSPAEREELRSIAERLGLLTTGSSDYHGHNKVLRLGQETTQPEVLGALVERSNGVTLPVGPAGSSW
jgi:predicted metal-dependent phosphoesterase TrpH